MKISYTEAQEYVLRSDDETFLGSLKFKNWASSKAEITTQFAEFYQIASKGFWGTSLGVSRDGVDYAELKMNWKGHIIIDLLENGKGVDFLMKPKNIWNTQYALFNRQEQEILIFIPDYKWSKGHYDFKIDLNPDFGDIANETLILIAVYGYLYLMMMAAASA